MGACPSPHHPDSYPNNIKLNNLLFPESIYNTQFDQINKIIQKRKKIITSRAILDSVEYQPGNIALATNIPVSAPKGTFKELQLLVQGVYYVKTVSPTHLRLIHLFTGEERTLPREHCTKITLDNLSTFQAQLQSHQLAKVSDTLFRANKHLTPDQTKTWNYLLNKDR